MRWRAPCAQAAQAQELRALDSTRASSTLTLTRLSRTFIRETIHAATHGFLSSLLQLHLSKLDAAARPLRVLQPAVKGCIWHALP